MSSLTVVSLHGQFRQRGAGIIVDGVRYDGVELAEAFVALAEAQFDAYAHAVLSDFPSDPATGRDEAAGT